MGLLGEFEKKTLGVKNHSLNAILREIALFNGIN